MGIGTTLMNVNECRSESDDDSFDENEVVVEDADCLKKKNKNKKYSNMSNYVRARNRPCDVITASS